VILAAVFITVHHKDIVVLDNNSAGCFPHWLSITGASGLCTSDIFGCSLESDAQLVYY
jgi:hypothetical protein